MKLNTGDVICDKCNGKNAGSYDIVCTKCHGSGKLDWIENIVGKKLEESNVIDNCISFGEAHPQNPKQGRLYYNISDGFLYMYDGSNWLTVESNASNCVR